jgi:hypothetical protein
MALSLPDYSTRTRTRLYASEVAQLATAIVAIDERLPNKLGGWTLAADRTTGTLVPASGSIYIARAVWLGGTLTNLHTQVTSAGSGLTAALMGVYTTAGVRQGVTASQTTGWTSTGAKTMALTTPVQLSVQEVLIAVLAAGTTRPTLASSGAAVAVNVGTSGSELRSAIAMTGQSSLPTPLTMTGWTAQTNVPFVGMS